MMRLVIKIFWISLMLLITIFASAQNNQFYTVSKHEADSLRLLFQHTKNDILKMSISKDLARYYLNNRDSSIFFTDQQLKLAKLLNQKLWEASALDMSSYLAYDRGDYPTSLKISFESLEMAENEACEKNIYDISKFSKEGNARKARLYILIGIYQQFAFLYDNSKNNEKTFLNYNKAVQLAESIDDQIDLSNINMNIGKIYLEADKLDSALVFEKRALANSMAADFKYYRGYILIQIGQIYFQQKNYPEAKKCFLKSFKISKEQNALKDEADAYNSLSSLYAETNQLDSSLFYAKKALKNCRIAGDLNEINRSYDKLFSTYKLLGNKDSAFAYLQLSKTLGDSLNNVTQDKINEYQNLNVNEQLNLQEKEKEKLMRENWRKIFALLIGLALFSFIAFILYRNNRQKQKANNLLQKQKEEIQSQRAELQQSLEILKATQSQLIQSEKLASLGELTAGIAHEIQNPLNFVNNFSELSVDLTKDLNAEIIKKPINEEYVKELMYDLTANQEKINHHGKRAASIVSGMLEHSRASTGKKELTDINKLADEYFGLSFHGLRAKNKDFNAEMITHFDTTIPKIEIIPQDVGRVILNLINNAFYAVNERRILDDGRQTMDNGNKNIYSPTVTVSTTKTENTIEIRVKDNGIGMSESIRAKVFQPFFTTKPTGQGTGLGLSLAYDIITKGHGGELKVESTEGVGSEFIIKLPI